MAAFSISYNYLAKNNIKHIYSYQARPAFVPESRDYGRQAHLHPLPLSKRFPSRFYDFYPAFGIGLPRAPAFNRLSEMDIGKMVHRLNQPIACQCKASTSGWSLQKSRRRKNPSVKWEDLTGESAGLGSKSECKGPSTSRSESKSECKGPSTSRSGGKHVSKHRGIKTDGNSDDNFTLPPIRQ